MHPNAKILQTFYTAFQQRDFQTMQSCYHDKATFSDPAFIDLNAKEVKAMWHMLCKNAKSLTIKFKELQANDTEGSIIWEAYYPFSATGRNVHNVISAKFKFKDGKIIEHRDSFDFWKWTRMALGAIGIFLGWSPFLQNKVRTTARKNLAKFIQENSQYQ